MVEMDACHLTVWVKTVQDREAVSQSQELKLLVASCTIFMGFLCLIVRGGCSKSHHYISNPTRCEGKRRNGRDVPPVKSQVGL